MAEKGIMGGKEREKRWVLRHERKRFRDRDKDLRVGEDDERMIFVIFIMGSLRRAHKF